MTEQLEQTATNAPRHRRVPTGTDRAVSGTVRDASLDVMRRLELTTIFGNPGSTEIPFLTDLPEDIRFVLGLHEGAVVGMATGYAIARGAPAFVNLHTAPGLGNAINAIANARDTRVPLVVVVGQQDRRQLAFEPFLTGRALERLAGEYPVWTNLPARAQDVPGAIARAYHEARAHRGPAIVVVPMGDWLDPADQLAAGSPEKITRAQTVTAEEMAEIAGMIADSRSPALIVGPGTDSREGWDAIVALAGRLNAPVWQEPFSRRAGFPGDHPLFAGHLPWQRAELHKTLRSHDLVLAIGTSAFRMYLFDQPSPLLDPGTAVAVITDDPAEAHRSSCQVAIVAPVPAACQALVGQILQRDGSPPPPMRRPEPPPPTGVGEPLTPNHVLAEVARRLPEDAVLFEETPSSQPELYRRIPIRSPLGFIAGANGGLGFGTSGAIGVKMGLPERPVVAILGDGSIMYAIQALWSAAQYGVGVLLIVMANGRYAIMDILARNHGGDGPWPAFSGIDIAGIAGNLGCASTRVETHDQLVNTLEQVLPDLATRTEPLLVEVVLGPRERADA
jgi:benzoylformate decarboxylase